jgi:hypothetical protein
MSQVCELDREVTAPEGSKVREWDGHQPLYLTELLRLHQRVVLTTPDTQHIVANNTWEDVRTGTHQGMIEHHRFPRPFTIRFHPSEDGYSDIGRTLVHIEFLPVLTPNMISVLIPKVSGAVGIDAITINDRALTKAVTNPELLTQIRISHQIHGPETIDKIFSPELAHSDNPFDMPTAVTFWKQYHDFNLRSPVLRALFSRDSDNQIMMKLGNIK